MSWSPWRVAVLVAAVAFLAGAAGWAIAQPRPPGNGSADVGFLHDMIEHHSQAVEMSSYLLRPDVGADPSVVLQAQSIAFGQEAEIGLMLGRLRAWDRPDAGDGTAMGWMGDPVPVDEMPGLATEDEIDALRDATGPAADEQFLRLMIEHHAGGVAMAEAAVDEASDGDVVDLARAMATAQRSEITEMVMLGERLGLDLSDVAGAAMGEGMEEHSH
ncbi:MAG TPA: DUF305 domain-containing protein [Acidimicrobiales bacterium]